MASQGGAEAPVNPTSVPVGAAEPASSPVEMNTVPSTGPEQAGDKAGTSQPPSQAPPADASASPPPPTDVPITRTESQAQAGAEAATSPSSHASGPTLSITLQLVTGARHPYKIDEKYLNSRKVEAKAADGSFDPRELSGYKLKELIWTDWRTEWEPKPASPGSIRLIRGGKFIQDNKPLSGTHTSSHARTDWVLIGS